MAEVVLDRVTKRYPNGFQAVTDLSLDISDSEFLVLVGPSGCGKSTALRMIAGLETISDGELRIGDTVVNTVPPKDRDIAMVFQNYALYPHMSVYDNIAFALKLAKMPKGEIDKRVKDAAGVLELSHYIDRKPGQLSGGQRQRVAMGRAIVRQPKAFLMDEPLSNLDAKLRVQMRAEIARIQKDLGVTTFYVTHDQVEAMTMGDRVAVIKDGFLQQVADPQTLYDRPDNLFVAGFIGSPAMNLFETKVLQVDGGLGVTIGGTVVRIPESVQADRPGLRAQVGKPIVAGIRPEDLEDVAMKPGHPADQQVPATVELVEALGSELVVHLGLDVRTVASGDPDALEAVGLAGDEARGIVVARFHPRSRVRLADNIQVAVDVERLHFFDATDGHAIWQEAAVPA
ncbi:MAG: ABC transporter ATP-binding protein [Acidimicrobiales bacterium]